VSADVLLVTATHSQDLERFRLLRRSLREVGAADQFHHLVAVDTEAVDVAAELRAEPNLEVILTRDLLPGPIERRRAAAHYRRTRWRRWARGGPIIPGWYAQQLIKLAVVARAGGATAIAFWDSDLIAIRPIERSDFIAESGVTKFFVDDDMRNDGSAEWNRVSARLLGVDEVLVGSHQFIHTPTVFDVRVAQQMLEHLDGDSGQPGWPTRMLASNAFEYPTYGAWVMGTSRDMVQQCAPLPTANFVDYEDMWDFKERAARVIEEGSAKVIGVQSRLHIPPASYEAIVAQAWS
jgi:hypothetical protein